jgi:hypothetical protein
MSEPSLNASSDSAPAAVIGYANPRLLLSTSDRPAWRDGAIVVLPRGRELPHACVKCGGPPEKLLRRNLTWYPPIAYLGLLVGVRPFGIIAVLLQKRATVMMPMCSRHLQRRKRSILIAWGVGLAGLSLAIAGPASTDGVAYIAAGIFICILSLMFGVTVASPLKPAKIDAECSYLKGAGIEFLNRLLDGGMSDVQSIPTESLRPATR